MATVEVTEAPPYYSDELTRLFVRRRKALGLSQPQAAKLIKVSTRSIQLYEQTPMTPSKPIRKRACAAYGVNPRTMEKYVHKRKMSHGLKSGHKTSKRGEIIQVAVWPGTPEYEEVKNTIREWREKRGMTQHQLATAIGVNIATLPKWMNGKPFPVNRLTQIESVLRIPTKGLLTSLASARVNDPNKTYDRLTVAIEELRRRKNMSQYDLDPVFGTTIRTRLIITKSTIPTAEECENLDRLFDVMKGTFKALASDRYLTRLWKMRKPKSLLVKSILGYMASELIGPREMADRVGVTLATFGTWLRDSREISPSNLAKLQGLIGPIASDDTEVVMPGSFYKAYETKIATNNSRQRLQLLAFLSVLADRGSTRSTWLVHDILSKQIESVRQAPLTIDEEFAGRIIGTYKLDSGLISDAFPIVEAICNIAANSDPATVDSTVMQVLSSGDFAPDQLRAFQAFRLFEAMYRIVDLDHQWSREAGVTSRYKPSITLQPTELAS